MMINLLDREDGLDENSSRARVSRVIVHALRAAGLSSAEAMYVWQECAKAPGCYLGEWDSYLPEFLK
jgi:hypothetical protein